ncbi:MAG TPA: type VI secretion system contractile sheath large subunit, partial [Syntrophobacteraceae bacterium]|nr:type VI secretion system contractile sheath large subunit [Syntrophobacteraceae bacterium]
MADQEQELQPQTAQAEVVQEEPSLLDQIIEKGRLARDESQKEWAKDIVGEFVKQVMTGSILISKDTEAMINARIAQIDQLISTQLNEVMHQPEFQKLEGSWRGLNYLVFQSETSEHLKIRVMNISKKDLLKDMERASEFDQSSLFKKIYEEEFGTFGGASYGALIGDYEFSNHPQDMSLLEKVSQVAAAAHAPFIAAAAPQLFNWESYTELGGPRDLAKIFQTVEYAKWKSFRESEDSRYVGLALPHILMRLPYGRE